MIPAVIVSTCIVTAYVFGLTVGLTYSVPFLWVVGIGCFALECGRSLFQQHSVKPLVGILCSVTILVFAVAAVYSWLVTRGALPNHFDDFSHWYRVSRVIFFDDSLPTSWEIEYRSYPPGAALWIYLGSRLVGFTPAHCLALQLIACFACLVALIPPKAASWKNGAVIMVLWLGLLPVLLGISTPMYSLLVDTMLALFGAAGAIFLLEHGSRTWRVGEVLAFAVMCAALVLIKNTAIIYLCFNFVLLAMMQRSLRPCVVPALGGGAAALLCTQSWKTYVTNTYNLYAVTEGPHAVSASRYLSVFQEHGAETNREIVLNFFKQTLNLSEPAVRTFLCVAAALLLWYFLSGRSKKAARMMGFSVVYILGYQLALLATYLFSMSAAEGVALSAFTRYYSAAAVYLIAVTGYLLLLDIAEKQTLLAGRGPILAGVCFAVAGLMLDPRFMLGEAWYHAGSGKNDYQSSSYRVICENVQPMTSLQEGEFLVVWDDTQPLSGLNAHDSWYVKQMISTHLRCNFRGCTVLTKTQIQDKSYGGLQPEELKKISKLVICSPMPDILPTLESVLGGKNYQVGVQYAR